MEFNKQEQTIMEIIEILEKYDTKGWKALDILQDIQNAIIEKKLK